ncbi:MAG TPA: DUF4179 domain-containing protein [Clostridiaceae bacterium]
MNKILEVLNNAEIDLDDYKDYELNDIEKKQIKKKIRVRINNKKVKGNRKMPAIAVVIFGLIFVCVFMSRNVLANVNIFGTSIEEFFHLKTNTLQNYKTVINKAVTDNGVTVKLNEFMMDETGIMIDSTFSKYTNNWSWATSSSLEPQVFINGKNILESGYGSGTSAIVIDSSTCSFLNDISPSDKKYLNLAGDFNVRIVFDKVNNGDRVINGNWVFEFTSNKDKISEITRRLPINKSFTTDEGVKVTIKDIRFSPLKTELDYYTSDALHFDIQFKLEDENMKEYACNSGFGNSYSEENPETIGYYGYDIIDDKIDKIKITPILKAMVMPKDGDHEIRVGYTKVLDAQAIEVNTR